MHFKWWERLTCVTEPQSQVTINGINGPVQYCKHSLLLLNSSTDRIVYKWLWTEQVVPFSTVFSDFRVFLWNDGFWHGRQMSYPTQDWRYYNFYLVWMLDTFNMIVSRKVTPRLLACVSFTSVCIFVIFEMTYSKYGRTNKGDRDRASVEHSADDIALEEGVMSEYEKNNALVQRCVDDVVYTEAKLKVVSANMTLEQTSKARRFPCTIVKVVSLETVLVFPVCLYDPAQDVSISAALLHKHTVFEESNLLSMERWLTREGDAGLIDIGANIGLFTSMAATRGFEVLAIEPKAENILRIQKAISLRDTGGHVTLIQNGISDIRSQMRLISHRREQGRTVVVCNKLCRNYDGDVCLDAPIDTILMDDLLEVIPFRKALMKIDVEGHEIRAFAKSDLLFSEVHIPLIQMEWAWRQNWQSRADEDRREVETFIDLLLSRGYQPQHESGKVLNIRTWDSWPVDVYWVLQKDNRPNWRLCSLPSSKSKLR